MLIVLPILAWMIVAFVLRARFPHWGWRLAALRSASLLSVYCVLAAELLSLFSRITASSLAFVWVLPLMAAGAAGGRSIREQIPKDGFLPSMWPRSWPMRVILLAILAVFALTAVVAWLAPPNTWDSLNTHMSRVAHWAQEHGIVPYATGIEKQNYYPPFPGTAILQSYVLTQSDRWANFAQWGAMVLSVVGVSLIAKQLGASPIGQYAAAAFAASLPMGIAQATSTMTDYLVALWLVVVALECLRLSKGHDWRESALFLSTGAALGINTKPVAFAYLLPFAIYAAFLFLRRAGLKRALLAACLCLTIVALINAGYIGRNLSLYGQPLGPRSGVDIHSNEILNWRVLVSNVLRNASLHAWSPIPRFNSLVYAGNLKIHQWLGLELADARTSMHGSFAVRRPSTDEKRAGNFYHAVMILILIIVVAFGKRKRVKDGRIFAAIVASTFLIFSLTFKFSIFGARYHLPFFVLFAPVAGLVASEYLNDSAQAVIALALVISSWSWLAGLDQRPLWPKEPGGDSLLKSSRTEMYFPSQPGYQKAYSVVSQAILENGCGRVGIALGGAAAEYPFWVMLGLPRGEVEIEWIIGDRAPSAAYRDLDFEPCALICDRTCPDEWQTFRGMPIALEHAGYRLYMISK